MNKVVLQEDLKKVDDKIGDLTTLDNDLKSQLITNGKTVDCVNALSLVFQCGNNVKQSTVTALLAKGAIGVTVDSPWADIITAIGTLTGAAGSPGTLKQVTKLNITASAGSPATKTVTLDGPLDDKLLLATSLLLFVPGDMGLVEHICGFDNTDSSNFNYDSSVITFDGKMHPINQNNLDWVDSGAIESYEYYYCEIDESLYKSVDAITDSSINLILGIVQPDQLITPKANIDLTGIERINSITENSQGFRFALSFDSGTTYNVWDGSSWVIVDINNLEDVKLKFMTKSLLGSLTNIQLEVLRNGSTTLRIAYWAEQTLSTDPCYTDQLDITVDMKGKDTIASQANWSYRVLEDKQTLEYTFYVSGTYTINYVGGGV